MTVEFEDDDDLSMNEQIDHDDNVDIPFSTKNIKVNTQTIALSTLIARLKYDEIDLQPSFQRKKDLWSKTQMSRLIESILLKMPLPIFYFDVSEPDKWLVVDGLQRLSTIKRFIVDCEDNKNPLRLTNLEFLKELDGRSYQELSRPLQRVIDETQIVTYQIEPQTPKEVRYSIFNRINTGGLKLNAQEIRQALNQKGIAVDFLAAQCETDEFKRVVKSNPERMLDRELALRFFAFKLLDVDDSFKNLSSFLDSAMEKIDEHDHVTQELKTLSEEFRQSLVFSETLLGENHKFSRTMLTNDNKAKKFNRSLFDVLTVCLSQVKDKEHLLNHALAFKEGLSALLADEQSKFSKAILQGTSSKRAVINRFDEMRKLIGKIEALE